MNINNKISYDLNSLVKTYNIDNVYEQYKRYEFLEKLSRYISLDNAEILEFGSASGQMTEILSKFAKNIVAVDGSKEFIDIAKDRVNDKNKVQFYESYFESFELDKKFDCLIMHHIMEHIEKPSLVLSHIKKFFNDKGIIAISVPNAHALSRQLAVKMGLLSSVYELSENDKHHGHYRVYDWKTIEEELINNGYEIIGRHGLSFKLFSDKQNVEMINNNIIGEPQIKALWQLGDEMKEQAGAIMIVAKKKLSFTEKNSKRKKLIDILPVKMPLGLCIEPTNKYNFKCKQCPVSLEDFDKIVGRRGDMPLDLFKKIVNDIKSMGKLNNLNLYGDGEPLLNQNIVEMLKIAKEKDIANAITITTNASLLNNELAEKLIDAGLDYLRISVYSIYEEKFKDVTQTKYSPEIIYNNIANIFNKRNAKNASKPFIYVKMINTYSEENENFIEKYKPISDEVNIETPMNWNGFNNLDLIGKIDKQHKTDTKTLQGYYGKVGVTNIKKICTTPFLSLNIKNNGDVCICIVDWNKGTKVGNIAEESLSDIWFGENLRKFRKMHIEQRRHENPSCKNCDFMYCNPDNMDDFTEEKYQEILNYKGK